MKFPQFSTAKLMLAITFTAIACAGVFSLLRLSEDSASASVFWGIMGLYSPIAVSGGFIGYAIGQKTLTVRMVVAFAVAQAIALGILAYVTWLGENS